MSADRFAYPEKLRFECTRCGDCCRGWRVTLGPGEREKLRALDWRGRADELAHADVLAREGSRDVLARRDDGACVFLGERNQCLIHEHFGADAKPLMCQLFPFGFLPVGERVGVDVSFACRSVSEGSGATLDVRVPEWTKLIGDARGAADAAQHRFSKKYRIDGELLWELEFHVLELLRARTLSMLDRVRAVSEFVRLATTSDPRTDAARKLRQVMVAGVPKLVRESAAEERMDKTQRAIFFHLLFLLLNPTPDGLRALSGKPRQKEVKRRVQAADGYQYDEAHPWLDNRELAASYGEIATVAPGYFLDGGGSELVERYFEAKVVGQRFMREGDSEMAFLDAVPRLLLLFPMTVWTAKALAAERGAPAVTGEDARRAVRLLDRSFGAVRLSELPSKQRKAWQFVLTETDLPTCASLDVLSTSEEREGG